MKRFEGRMVTQNADGTTSTFAPTSGARAAKGRSRSVPSIGPAAARPPRAAALNARGGASPAQGAAARGAEPGPADPWAAAQAPVDASYFPLASQASWPAAVAAPEDALSAEVQQLRSQSVPSGDQLRSRAAPSAPAQRLPRKLNVRDLQFAMGGARAQLPARPQWESKARPASSLSASGHESLRPSAPGNAASQAAPSAASASDAPQRPARDAYAEVSTLTGGAARGGAARRARPENGTRKTGEGYATQHRSRMSAGSARSAGSAGSTGSTRSAGSARSARSAGSAGHGRAPAEDTAFGSGPGERAGGAREDGSIAEARRPQDCEGPTGAEEPPWRPPAASCAAGPSAPEQLDPQARFASCPVLRAPQAQVPSPEQPPFAPSSAHAPEEPAPPGSYLQQHLAGAQQPETALQSPLLAGYAAADALDAYMGAAQGGERASRMRARVNRLRKRRARPQRAQEAPREEAAGRGRARNEEIAAKEPDKAFYFSRAPRRVQEFKPYTLGQYKATQPTEYVEISNLPPDLSSEALQAKRANSQRVRQFSDQLRVANRELFAKERVAQRQRRLSAREKDRKLTGRERALAFAKGIPKPKPRRDAAPANSPGPAPAPALVGEPSPSPLERLEAQHQAAQAEVDAIRRQLGVA